MKRLQKTDFINKLLASAVGPDVDTTNFPVWEVAATSSVPLRGKTGTIFENAVIQDNTLFQLAAAINRDPLPLMMDHNMEGTPYGKFFYAEVMPNEYGYQELRGFKYVDPTEATTVAKIDNGTLNEVSIAFASQEMRCNKCGFDYAKAIDEGNIMPAVTRTCENGHTIGKDGTHVQLIGVKDTLELSLVSRGAAKNSKIVGQSDSKLSREVERLAAHGLSLSDVYVTASASQGFDNMDMNDLIVQLSDSKAKAAVAESNVTRLERELAEVTGARNEAESRTRQLEADLAAARAEQATAPDAEALAAAEKDTKASVDFLQKQYVAVLSAAGKTDVVAPETVSELIAGIEEHKAELSAILPTGGVALGANSNGEGETKADMSVFRTVRQNKR